MTTYHIGDLVEQRAAFGQALLDLGDEFPDLVVLDPDVAASTRTAPFRDKYPQRFFQTGIAEQNMAGIAAGLTTMGFIPVASAFAVFLTHRSGDQVRNSIAHPRAHVILNGAYGGLPTGGAGATHSAVEDVALMRALPNMTVLDPADATEVALFLRLAVEGKGPVYLRTVRCGVPVIFDETHTVAIGKAVPLSEGNSISVISTGMMTPRVKDAAASLAKKGIRLKHLHMPTIKPLDTEAVLDAAKNGAIVTVENHSVIGGLGSAVAETIAEAGVACKLTRLGFQDIFLETGNDEALFDQYGLSEAKIGAAISAALR